MPHIKLDVFWASEVAGTAFGTYAVWLVKLSQDKVKTGLHIEISEKEMMEINDGMNHVNDSSVYPSDFFKDALKEIDARVREVVIDSFDERNRTFYAHAVITHGAKEKILVCPVAVAIALAVRFNCPIFIEKELFYKHEYPFDDFYEDFEQRRGDPTGVPGGSYTFSRLIEKSEEEKPLEKCTVKELEEKLNIALSQEDYEHASMIRDLIKKSKELGGDSPKAK